MQSVKFYVNSNKKNNGFTLIEVLIALVILAIAFIAVFQSMRQTIRISERVQEKIEGEWVAKNILSQMQSGVLTISNSDSSTDGEVKNFSHTWHWKAQILSSTDDYYSRVELDIFLGNKMVGSLDGFVFNKSK